MEIKPLIAPGAPPGAGSKAVHIVDCYVGRSTFNQPTIGVSNKARQCRCMSHFMIIQRPKRRSIKIVLYNLAPQSVVCHLPEESPFTALGLQQSRSRLEQIGAVSVDAQDFASVLREILHLVENHTVPAEFGSLRFPAEHVIVGFVNFNRNTYGGEKIELDEISQLMCGETSQDCQLQL